MSVGLFRCNMLESFGKMLLRAIVSVRGLKVTGECDCR